MIEKTISTAHGDCKSTAEISHDDNGTTQIHVCSTLGDLTHEHRVTIGAEDGHDSVRKLSAEQLKTSLQKHLDEIRQNQADILAGRAQIKTLAEELV